MKKMRMRRFALTVAAALVTICFTNNVLAQNVNVPANKTDSTYKKPIGVEVKNPLAVKDSSDTAKYNNKYNNQLVKPVVIYSCLGGIEYGKNDSWVTMFDLGINSYTHEGSITLPNSLNGYALNLGKSIEFNWHILESAISFVPHRLFMTYGLELNVNNYRFSNNVSFNPKATYTMPYIDSTMNFSKDKLVTQFLSVPLMLHFEVKEHHSRRTFEIAAGGFAGILINSHLKQISPELGKVKYYNGYNLNQYKYGITAKIGFGPLEFYANYAMSTLFQNGKGPELTPFSVGIVLGTFSWK